MGQQLFLNGGISRRGRNRQRLKIPLGTSRNDGAFEGWKIRKKVGNNARTVFAENVGHPQIVGSHCQRTRHEFEQVSALDGCPGFRCIAQQFILYRIVGGFKRFNIGIDTSGVGFHNKAGDWVGHHHIERTFGSETHTHPPIEAVGFESTFANDLGQSSCRSMGLKFHLPEPVSGCYVALCKIGIGIVLSKNMGNAIFIVPNSDGLGGTFYVHLRISGVSRIFGILPKACEWTQ